MDDQPSMPEQLEDKRANNVGCMPSRKHLPLLVWIASAIAYSIMLSSIRGDPDYLVCGDGRSYEIDFRGTTYCVGLGPATFHYALNTITIVGVAGGFGYLFIRWLRRGRKQ